MTGVVDGPRTPVDGTASPVHFVAGGGHGDAQTSARRGSFLFRSESDDNDGGPHISAMTGSASAARLTSLLPNQLHEMFVMHGGVTRCRFQCLKSTSCNTSINRYNCDYCNLINKEHSNYLSSAQHISSIGRISWCVWDWVCQSARPVERSTSHNIPPIFTKLTTKVAAQDIVISRIEIRNIQVIIAFFPVIKYLNVKYFENVWDRPMKLTWMEIRQETTNGL